MKRKIWFIPMAAIVIIAVMWFSGIVPKQIAKISGTSYVKEHFPEMQLECVNVEWADVYGDYLISFKDKDGSTYSCVIGPSFFPCALGQGLFAIEDYYAENYDKPNGRDTLPDPAYTYIVTEVSESNLLVAEIGENGKAIETRLYSVPNLFHPSNEIETGDKITINHNDGILETFPMGFAEIYSMEYYDKETGLSVVVNVD